MSHKSQQTPSVGRVVHVVTFDGHHRPADILDPQDGITICVLAKVKPTDLITNIRPHNAVNAVLWFLDNCPHDPTAQQPGSWHWPEFVPPASEPPASELSQLTLGVLSAALEAMPTDTQVANLRNPHRYRGSCDVLAFEI